MNYLSQLLSKIANFLSNRKGLLLFIAIGLIVLNFILELFLKNWLTQVDLFLHLGVIIGLIGILLAWAL